MTISRLWLPLLVVTLIAELAWGLVEWLLFLARCRARKEEIKVLLLGKTAGKLIGCVITVAAVMAIMAGAAGCQTNESNAARDDRPPIIRAEDVTLRKAEDTLVEILTPVYGTSSPPMEVLNATILEADPESGRAVLETLAELLVP